MKYITLCFLTLSTNFLAAKSDTHNKILQAAKENNLKELRSLISNNANINAKNGFGQTPLHVAQDPNIIHELIIAGAHINSKDHDGTTPLHQALFDKNKHKAMMLLTAGAKPNSMVNGATPLHWAIEQNDYQLAFELVKAGAKVTQPTITYAQHLGATEIATLLSYCKENKGKKSPLHILNKHGQTKMHTAAAENNAILVDSLLLAGASIDCKNAEGQTPLHIAIENNYHTMTNKLLNLKANINVKDKNGKTPLQYATKKESFEICQLLKNRGAI